MPNPIHTDLSFGNNRIDRNRYAGTFLANIRYCYYYYIARVLHNYSKSFSSSSTRMLGFGRQ